MEKKKWFLTLLYVAVQQLIERVGIITYNMRIAISNPQINNASHLALIVVLTLTHGKSFGGGYVACPSTGTLQWSYY